MDFVVSQSMKFNPNQQVNKIQYSKLRIYRPRIYRTSGYNELIFLARFLPFFILYKYIRLYRTSVISKLRI